MSGDYSREQLESMQREAERRVMEMRRRSKAAADGTKRPEGTPLRETPAEKGHTASADFEKDGKGGSFFRNNEKANSKGTFCDGVRPSAPHPRFSLLDLLNTDKMMSDGDSRLVLLVMALLAGEKADPILLFSLLYIIL